MFLLFIIGVPKNLTHTHMTGGITIPCNHGTTIRSIRDFTDVGIVTTAAPELLASRQPLPFGKRLQKTMERSTNFNGKTHYFYGHFQ